MLSRTIICLGVILALGACTFSKKTPDEMKAEAIDDVSKKFAQVAEDKKEASILESDVSVEFVGTEEPNRYLLKVTISKKVPVLAIGISGNVFKLFNNTDKATIELSPELRSFELKIRTHLEDKTQVSDFSLGVQYVPSDYIFIGRHILQSNYYPMAGDPKKHGDKVRYNRIFIGDKSIVDLNGFDLVLDANEIISLGENIITQTKSASVVTGKHLPSEIMDGSGLKIYADKATGKFFINHIGIDGRDGERASSLAFPTYVEPAFDGKPGRDGSVRIVAKPLGVDGDGRPTVIETALCERAPTDGENGWNGKVVHGEDGTDGGNTGDLEIDIQDYSQAQFVINFYPGRGGQGGAGDFEGHKGGRGGKAGKWPGAPCPKAKDGKDGITTTSADSHPGKDGRPGHAGKIIVPNNSQHFHVQTQHPEGK